VVLAALVDVGAVLEQQRDHRRLLLGGGPHQRGLAAPAFLGIDVGALAEQQLGGVDLPVRATAINSVCPSALGASTSPPAAMSASMIAGLPCSAATVMGVAP